MTERYETKTLVHPHARKGEIHAITGKDLKGEFTDYHGDPDILPPVTVNNPDQEAFYRARGYLAPGEKPAPPPEYSEYPVMLNHPDHVDAIPEELIPRKTEQGIVVDRIPGRAEKFPPMVALDAGDEKRWAAKGYVRSSVADPDAVRSAHASPYDPGLVKQEWPKQVNGVLMMDPKTPHAGVQQYPKWSAQLNRVIESAEEEAKLCGTVVVEGPQPGPASTPDLCVICGEAIGEDDPVAKGVMGRYHLAHMAVTAAQAMDVIRNKELGTTESEIQAEGGTAAEASFGPPKPRRGRPPGSGAKAPDPE